MKLIKDLRDATKKYKVDFTLIKEVASRVPILNIGVKFHNLCKAYENSLFLLKLDHFFKK